jgi:hypothetical protein
VMCEARVRNPGIALRLVGIIRRDGG